jgi:hypothetical protein
MIVFNVNRVNRLISHHMSIFLSFWLVWFFHYLTAVCSSVKAAGIAGVCI